MAAVRGYLWLKRVARIELYNAPLLSTGRYMHAYLQPESAYVTADATPRTRNVSSFHGRRLLGLAAKPHVFALARSITTHTHTLLIII